MSKKILLAIFLLSIIIILPIKAKALTLGERLSGYILLQVEENGEAWYVYPNNLQKYYLGRPNDAFQVMRKLGLGATHSFITNNTIFPASVSGKILLDVETSGEAYYIYPKDRKKYYLGRPDDAFRIMRNFGLGITNTNLSQITDGALGIQGDAYSNYEEKQIAISSAIFSVKIVTIDLATPNLKIITDTASDNDCDFDCPVKPLADYVSSNGGFAAIHGSYFCAADYTTCSTTKNYFFYPVYNSRLEKMINADQLKWPTTGLILVFDSSNHPYFFLSTQDFKDVPTFEKTYNTKISAAIGNQPALIYNNVNLVNSLILDDKQRTSKSNRGGLGLKNNKIYLITVGNATVVDLANIMESLGMEQAMNLDGGGSTALYYEGTYKIGPGRNLPNALIFKK